MRIAILSNVTVEVLAGMLGKEHELWLAPGFDAWLSVALNPPDNLRAFAPEAIYLLLDFRYAPMNVSETMRVDAVTALRAAFPGVPVIVPDIAALAVDLGDSFFEEKMWKLGAMPWSLKGLRELCHLFGRKKAIAVDFDNTLWQGVVGEDGVSGIVPNEDIQRRLLELKNRGVLLVALSKNNADDIAAVWSDPRMILKRDDFAAMRVDWADKPSNLRQLARELNFGADAFVFVDDNPAERAQMRMMAPEVAVADFPPQLDAFFPEYPLTVEDRNKTEQYRAEASRREFAAGKAFDEYLAGLEIHTDVHPIGEGEIERVSQLSQKSNQFNVCANRYSCEEIRRFAADANCLLLTMHAGDRFGDQGLVAFVLARMDGNSAEILDWVMSCRAMNRNVEFALQDELERLLVFHGVVRLSANWRQTAKNAPVKVLFERFGFKVLSESVTSKSYIKELGAA